MKLALAQFGVAAPADLDDFLARIAAMAHAAVKQNADILVLPEYAAMVLAGAFIKAPDIAAELAAVVDHADSYVAGLQKIAAGAGVYLLAGTVPMPGAQKKIHNRAPFISPTGKLVFQDKQSMTRFEAERWDISPGAGPQVFATRLGKIGVSICYDSEFPLHVRAQVNAGANLILVPSCTDNIAGFNRVRLSARARAVENQCIVAVSPLVGNASWSGAIDENHGYAGVYGPPDRFFPESGVLTRGKLDEPGIIYADIDLALIEAVRREGAVLNHRDWPDDIAPCPVVEL